MAQPIPTPLVWFAVAISTSVLAGIMDVIVLYALFLTRRLSREALKRWLYISLGALLMIVSVSSLIVLHVYAPPSQAPLTDLDALLIALLITSALAIAYGITRSNYVLNVLFVSAIISVIISVGLSGKNGVYLLSPGTLVFGITFMAVAGAFYAAIPLEPRLMRLFGTDFMRESLAGVLAFYLIAPIGMLVLLAIPNTLAPAAETLLPSTYAVLASMLATAAIHILIMLGKPRVLRKYAVPIIIIALIITLSLALNLVIIEMRLPVSNYSLS